MKKRQMKIDQMKEEEFKDVTASAGVTTVKHDNDFEAAMKKRKAKIGEKVEGDQSLTSEVSEASTVKAVTVHEFKSEEHNIQMSEERTTKMALVQSHTEFYSDSEIEQSLGSVLDNSAQAVVIEVPQKNFDGRFQTEDPHKSEEESTNKEIGEISVSPAVLILDKNSKQDEQTIKLRVTGARNLKKSGMFGKADPYVTISYGELKLKSNVVKNNLNPEWNFDNVLTISDNISKEILLEVYDKDTVSKDDFMGKIPLSTSEVIKLQAGQWIPLQGTKSGEIFVACDIVTDDNVSSMVDDKEAKNYAGILEPGKDNNSAIRKSASPVESLQNRSLKEEKASDEIDPSTKRTSAEVAASPQERMEISSQISESKGEEILSKDVTMKLTVIAARKLKKTGLFGKADPYVALSYGTQKTKSNVVKNSLNPEWNFESLLTLNENASDEVLLEVYDKDTGSKDDFMGKVSLQIAELKKMKQGQWIPLQKTKSGEVCLSCDFMKGHTTSTATEERDTFERVESVEELETATLTDLRIKKGGGSRAVKELLSAPKRSQEDLSTEPTEESSKELFLPAEIKSQSGEHNKQELDKTSGKKEGHDGVQILDEKFLERTKEVDINQRTEITEEKTQASAEAAERQEMKTEVETDDARAANEDATAPEAVRMREEEQAKEAAAAAATAEAEAKAAAERATAAEQARLKEEQEAKSAAEAAAAAEAARLKEEQEAKAAAETAAAAEVMRLKKEQEAEAAAEAAAEAEAARLKEELEAKAAAE